MTTPAQPDTGAGSAAPDTGSAPEGTTTETAPEQTTGTDVTDWQAEAEKWKTQARKHEERSKANKKALDDALNASKPKAGEPGPEDWQRQVAEATERATAAETRAAELAYRSTVSRIAATVNADADALLDSDSFLEAVETELGDDFDDDELAAAVTKVAKEYAKKLRFAKQTGPARSGADISGGPAGLRQLTEDDLQRMSPEQIVDAQNKGQLNSLLGIT